MPTIQFMDLPEPKNWQEFETIVRDAMMQRWKSSTLQMNGRPGQKQQGIDISGPDDIGRPIGIQCKKYDTLKIKTVTDEIKNAEDFKGKLTTLFVATTADHDARLQEQVRAISDQRVAQGKFAVALLFWDEIVASLLLNPAVFQAHYPQIALPKSSAVDKDRLLAALEAGYYGADLWGYVTLTYGEFGWLAQTDPDELMATLRVVERRVQLLLPPEDASPIVEALVSLKGECLKPKSAKSDWDAAEMYAKRATMRINRASSFLTLLESSMLDLGLQLGRIYHHTDDLPTPEIRSSIEANVRSALPASSDGAITAKFASAAKLGDGYRWALRIYGLLEREIRLSL
jgi:hypothetical protein